MCLGTEFLGKALIPVAQNNIRSRCQTTAGCCELPVPLLGITAISKAPPANTALWLLLKDALEAGTWDITPVCQGAFLATVGMT